METLYQSPHDIGMAELKRDVVFRKIPPEQYDELISFAWGKGEKAARDYTEKLGTSIPSEMAKPRDSVLMLSLIHIFMWCRAQW